MEYPGLLCQLKDENLAGARHAARKGILVRSGMKRLLLGILEIIDVWARLLRVNP
jgi:hypothetical protein